jgi:RNA polymerase sigma-70 factor, ECF subfamily
MKGLADRGREGFGERPRLAVDREGRGKDYHRNVPGRTRPVSTNAAEIANLLKAWGRGDAQALERLTPLVYDQLLRLARRQMRTEREGHSLQTTALVHEAYLRLAQTGNIDWHDRVHFFAVAAQMMRRILVDAARARATRKRGGGQVRVDQADAVAFDGLPALSTERAADICAVDDALASLARIDPRRARVVELRFFGGLTIDETAAVMNISPQTVMRDWNLARAWLTRELRPS